VTEPEPEPEEAEAAEGAPPAAETPAAETPEEKRARIMRRLAEMIRADPPDLSGGGPVPLGAFPELPDSADEFDQEAAAELLAALQGLFEQRRPAGPEEASQDLEKE
jgi:hypothetical protein